MLVLSKSAYKNLTDEIKQLPPRRRYEILLKNHPEIPSGTIASILAQEQQRYTRNVHARLTSSESLDTFHKTYLQAIQASEQPGILLRLSQQMGLSPALLARVILERHLRGPEDKEGPSRQYISSLLRNTALIPDRDLAVEVYLCVLEDEVYGPLADSIRQSVGNEYEVKLRRELKQLGIAFLHEEQLRSKGYDKTPDIKLEIPIAIEGQVINWIESKALFGDEENHQGYVRDQLSSYHNRFGPGLVIYWFGHVAGLEVFTRNLTILIRTSLPTEFVTLKT